MFSISFILLLFIPFVFSEKYNNVSQVSFENSKKVVIEGDLCDIEEMPYIIEDDSVDITGYDNIELIETQIITLEENAVDRVVILYE